MIFEMVRVSLEEWAMTPSSGVYEGEHVGSAQNFRMTDVSTVGRALVGRLRAVSGARLREDVFRNKEFRREFQLGGVHEPASDYEMLTLDFDGLVNWEGRPVKSAKVITVVGALIYGHNLTMKG